MSPKYMFINGLWSEILLSSHYDLHNISKCFTCFEHLQEENVGIIF